jgi:glycine hydroxymethyltransferase
MNTIAGIATAFSLAKTEQFRELQQQTVKNAKHLAEQLEGHGLRIPHGGTDTHLLLVDCKSITSTDGVPLSGDMAARILDVCGIVVNRNTIPGDTSAGRATGIRLGTPWITQRGFKAPQIDELAEVIADVLKACEPFAYDGHGKKNIWRAKVDFDVLERAKRRVRDLAQIAGIDYEVKPNGYPHHYYVEDNDDRWATLEIIGPKSVEFLNLALTSLVFELQDGDSQPAWMLRPDGTPVTRCILTRQEEKTANGDLVFHLHVEQEIEFVAAWLRDLSDGYVAFDPVDVQAKLVGPVVIRALRELPDLAATGVDIDGDWMADKTGFSENKVFYVGVHNSNDPTPRGKSKPYFEWEEPAEEPPLQKTSLHAVHLELGAKMVPFAGWEMPVWYTSVSKEHEAVRTGAGLFDVAHMGVFEFSSKGASAALFLNGLTANDIESLKFGLHWGMAHYSYLLDTNGIPIDDIFVYRLDYHTFMVVVNAANNDKDWEWVNGLREGRYAAGSRRDYTTIPGRELTTIRDLRAASSGDARRVDLALQGPKSRDVLLSLGGSDETKEIITRLPWAGVTRAVLGGYDLVVARTGYTGERIAYELFVHPDAAPDLFKDLIERGATPCGLASRDSTRTEAGLPLYGHELAGPLNLGPGDAGFASYVKLWQPFFVGKRKYMEHEATRDSEIVRFRMDDKGVRMPTLGDPVVDRRGRVVGTVTSCAIDSEGYLLGQAYVKLSSAEDGTRLGIFQTGGKATVKAGKDGKLEIGGRVQIPSMATVLSRFPRRKKK